MGAVWGTLDLLRYVTIVYLGFSTLAFTNAGLGLVGLVLSAVVLAQFRPAPFTYGGVGGGTNDHLA